MVNGKNNARGNNLNLNTVRCKVLAECLGAAPDSGPLNLDIEYKWSDKEFWFLNVHNEEGEMRVPSEGESVIIKSPWLMKLD